MIVAALVVQQATLESFKGTFQSLAVAPEIATSRAGVESIQLVVSPDGVVVACNARIVGRGVVDDPKNCKKLLKLKATAAIDQEGHKIYGMANILLTWTTGTQSFAATPGPGATADFYLPVSRLPEGSSGGVASKLTLVAGPDGKVETCEISHSSGSSVLDNAACRAVEANGVTPIKDGTGTAVRAVHSVTVGFTAQP